MKNNMMKNNMMQAAAPSLTMPYGKHFGEDIASVPPAYLQWFLANCKTRREVKNAIQEALNPPKFSITAPVPMQELASLADAKEKASRTLAAVIEKKNEGKKRSKP